MKTFLLIFSLLLSTQAFSQTRKTLEADYKAILALFEATKSLSKAQLGCQSSRDCKAIALGNRACGGPSDYLIASLLNNNFKEILTLAKVTQNIERRFNIDNQVVSICIVERAPTLECIENLCQEVR